MVVINISICTCKRAQLLKQCLDSVAKIEVPAAATVIVTVIDNDAEGSAKSVVNSLSEHFPFPLHYFCETRRGIPCARNRAIDEAHRLNSDYLVFIDDDEWVRPDWLRVLFDYCVSQGGNIVVSGDVVSELPAETPADMRAMYARKTRHTGQRLASCATNNVLIPIAVTKTLGVRFDESNPLAGGTDTIFFCAAVAKGAVIHKCVEAIVHESVPANRTTLSWWAKRKYRAGITEAWRKRQKGRSAILIVFTAGVRCLLDFVVAGVAAMLNKKTLRNQYYLKAWKAAGVVAGVWGARVESYKQIDGR